ncbi:MAG: leucine-rich repeat protein [Alistipes sp.]|nr:leucine-rich repeat protein [Candidatus Alistipes equi]
MKHLKNFIQTKVPLVLLTLFLGFTFSCREEDESLPSLKGTSFLKINFQVDSLEAKCRGEEETIENLTVYLSGKDFLFFRCIKADEGKIRLECPKGKYDCYCIANSSHEALSSIEEVKRMILKKEDLGALWAYTEVECSPEAQNIVTLRRCRTKFRVDVKVDKEKQDEIELLSFRFMNLKKTMQPFMEGSSMDFYNEEEHKAENRDYLYAECEMFENLAGENPNIESEMQRSEKNAPAGASYLLIRARNQNEILYYKIFLGENTTTSFNLKRNTVYSLEVQIKGDSKFEERLSRYEIFWNVRDKEKVEGYFFPSTGATLEITSLSSGNTTLSVSFEVIRGEREHLKINGEYLFSRPFEITPNSTEEFQISYTPEVVRDENSSLELRLRFLDQSGYSFENTLTLNFVNAIRIMSTNLSHIDIEALGVKFLLRESTSSFLAGATSPSITLKANKTASYRFRGWIKDGVPQKTETFLLPITTTYQEQLLLVEYAANKIFYKTTSSKLLPIEGPLSADAEVVSNTYSEGEGTILFDMDVETLLDGAFEGQSTLLEITLPETLLSLEKSLFEGCSNLEEVTLPLNIIKIPTSCFQRCRNLSEIHLPDKIEIIEEGAFSGCENLQSVLWPASLRRIEKSAFYLCRALETVSFSNQTESIDNWAFYGCSALKRVKFEDGLLRIGHFAFENCRELQTVEFPYQLQEIGEGAFHKCESLSQVEFLSFTSPQQGYYQNGWDAFYDCFALERILVPKGALSSYQKMWPMHKEIIKERP